MYAKIHHQSSVGSGSQRSSITGSATSQQQQQQRENQQRQSRRLSRRGGAARKISTRSCQLQQQQQQTQTAQLRQLSIDFDEGEVCFAPGNVITGVVVIGAVAATATTTIQPQQPQQQQSQSPPPPPPQQQQQPALSAGRAVGIGRQQSEDGTGKGGPAAMAMMSARAWVGEGYDFGLPHHQHRQPPVTHHQCLLEIVELKMRVHGGARVKGRNRVHHGREQSYLDMESELIGQPSATQGPFDRLERMVQAGNEKLIRFEIRLPQKGLCTSVESKCASIVYVVRLSLSYRNLTSNETHRANAARGFTIVECLDVARLPNCYFQPASHHLTKKFGLFSCTGGQIRLHFSINRSAFVSGENIVIEGRIENRTDRRVDKVAAVLQQVVVVHGGDKANNLNLLDVVDIHEDNLALFVDQGTVLKIERNFALPPLPPSTFALDGSEPEAVYEAAASDYGGKFAASSTNGIIDFSIGGGRRRYNRRSSSSQIGASGAGPGKKHLQPADPRFLKVLYQLCIRVTTAGVEVMEINVPILIGSLPQRKLCHPIGRGVGLLSTTSISADPLVVGPPQNSFTRAAAEAAATFARPQTALFANGLSFEDDAGGGGGAIGGGQPMALFMQNKREATARLGLPGELHICSKSELVFANKYPFFVNLPTSSKQSRKVSILAHAIRAENSFLNTMWEEQQRKHWLAGQQLHRHPNGMPQQQLQQQQQWHPNKLSSLEQSQIQQQWPATNLYQHHAADHKHTTSAEAAEPAYQPSAAAGNSAEDQHEKCQGRRPPRRQSTLPPVEVLVEHFRRSSVSATAAPSVAALLGQKPPPASGTQ